ISRFMTISTDNPERDKKIIIENFMEELCRRDDEDNKVDPIVFPVEEIRQIHLRTFEIEYVKGVLREYILENSDNEPIEFLDNEQNVRLTDAGRARCHKYGL
ncbi:MAG: hypothetical protein ACJ72T_01120, partial [Nitrososphaeraceae archaeon]